MITVYNRYIPQPDGSYRRSREPDRCPPAAPKPQAPDCAAQTPQEVCPPACKVPKSEVCTPPCPPPKQEPCPPRRTRRQESCSQPCQGCKQDPHSHRPEAHGSIGGFLRQLLPRDLDTGDLLIILLLLLMSGDCAEDQNTALLTLALYLFM